MKHIITLHAVSVFYYILGFYSSFKQ